MSVNLRAERLNRGLSANRAAGEMGLNSKTILLSAENGNGVHPENAKKIADFYGYQVTDIWPLPEEAAA